MWTCGRKMRAGGWGAASRGLGGHSAEGQGRPVQGEKSKEDLRGAAQVPV